MPIDYPKRSDWLSLKVGEKARVTIVNSYRVDKPGSQFNFKSQAEGDLGYHFVLELSDGKKFTLNTFALMGEFQKFNIQDGDTLTINHVANREWRVEDVEKKKEEEKEKPAYLDEIEKRNTQEQPQGATEW